MARSALLSCVLLISVRTAAGQVSQYWALVAHVRKTPCVICVMYSVLLVVLQRASLPRPTVEKRASPLQQFSRSFTPSLRFVAQCTTPGTRTAYADGNLLFRFTPSGISSSGTPGDRSLVWEAEDAGAVGTVAGGTGASFTMNRIDDPLASFIV
jgi:hypothetical protein